MSNFIELCKEKGYTTSIVLFEKALSFARKYLADKKRLAGDSYFDHNVRVATILVENKAEPEMVVSGLLHGILAYAPAQEVREGFGAEIVQLLLEVEGIKAIKSKNKKMEAEAVRKILLTTLQDVRVVIVKLAAKLDNLRSIEVLPVEEQKRIAQEVLEIYAPLAYRLGVERMRVQLEDSAFRILNPRKYQEINTFLEETREQRERKVEETISLIGSLAAGKVDIAAIKGRSKHIYSIYKKLQHDKNLRDLYDLLGIRVMVKDVQDCYILLGLLHEHFEPMEGRLKDYIATPKPNGYQSIHTGIKLPDGSILEVQIRTAEMDELAEEGLAAHWQYKGISSEEQFEKKVAWLRGVLNLQKTMENKEFLETATVDVFGDTIYCYTPKGEAKELPSGATVLDFAYLVHQDIGDHAVGARVNGRFVPLKEGLKLGDVVEVLTNKNQRPRRSWLKVVKSGRARQKIRKSLKEHEQLAPFHFRPLKPAVTEEQGVLTEAVDFPAARCEFAKCCLPIPSEDIVGLVTKRRVISVHRQDCRAALKEEMRWVKVSWKNTFGQKLKFFVRAEERSGLLADLLNTIAQAGFEVKEAKAKLLDIGHAEASFLVVPRDLEQLKELVRRLMNVKGVKRIYFE
ncbi:TPA: bifunctional (p)ppGpp synthetase/guanosine-3',5'-bis(diphosphate) 3'-pyrophosphohydrolase [Candidatus Woesearchaeota archaeon]|nr:bifunctional (p)ppGpp synthetase/guanosine-3',5'-bis(diphosphate) 3'-pyrophosphohydrolase [Candidatus Woesearchaeota archaeon]